jgi:uncharacterized membrane protein YgdD (TMEM256/DUF423 family)
MSARLIAVLAVLIGFSGVLTAALGSHAVPGMDDPANYRSWQAASLLHLSHAPVLLVLAMSLRSRPERWVFWAACLMTLGVLTFSGSIYARLILSLPDTANVAPAGGMVLLAAWLMLMLAMLRD